MHVWQPSHRARILRRGGRTTYTISNLKSNNAKRRLHLQTISLCFPLWRTRVISKEIVWNFYRIAQTWFHCIWKHMDCMSWEHNISHPLHEGGYEVLRAGWTKSHQLRLVSLPPIPSTWYGNCNTKKTRKWNPEFASHSIQECVSITRTYVNIYIYTCVCRHMSTWRTLHGSSKTVWFVLKHLKT